MSQNQEQVRVVLVKNDKATEENRYPQFYLKIPSDTGDWKTVAALWKSKTGKSLSGAIDRNVGLVFNTEQAPAKKQPQDDFGQM